MSSRTRGIALVILGLAIGFAIAFVWGAGSTSPNLPIGLLLIIVGAIIGFVVEWLIDESVRRNRDLQKELEDSQKGIPVLVEGEVINRPTDNAPILAEVLRQLHALQTSPQPSETATVKTRESEVVVEVLRQHKEELRQLSTQVSAKDAQVDELRQKFAAYRKTHPDELTHIKGIGPVFQRKLRDVGFNSFEDLAQADPAQIRRMLDIKTWQKVDIESWVQQAKDWAEHN